MKLNSLLFSICIITYSSLIAQVGYLGKTIYGMVNLNSSLNITQFNKDGELKFLQPSLSLSVSGHKVIHKGFEVNGFYKHNSSMDNVFLEDDDSFFNGYGIIHQVKSNYFGIGFRFYHKGYNKNFWVSAPLGRYIELKPFIKQVNALPKFNFSPEVDDYNFDEDFFITEIKNADDEIKLTEFGLGIGFGQQAVLFDRVPINFGVQLNLTSGMASSLFWVDSYQYDDLTDKEKKEISISQRSALTSLIEFKVGIGFLAK